MATAEEGVDVERARLAVDRHVDLKPPLDVGPWRVGSRHRGWGRELNPRSLLNVVSCPGGGLTGSGERSADLIE
jgi:hypothetical protein